MRKYSPNVLIGNWFDELILGEEKTKIYMRKSKNGELKVEKARQLFLSLLTEIPLTFPTLGLSYGSVIQIVSPGNPPTTKFKIPQCQGIALAADMTFQNADKRSIFAINDPVIGTGLLTPCVRNVWTLVPDNKSCQGKEVRYGDSFHIKLYKSDQSLYVRALANAPSSPIGECGYVVPKLAGHIDPLTRFTVVHINPRMRYETEGSVVQPFEAVAILQAATTASLAVELDTWLPTYFGMECEVSLHTYKNLAKPLEPDPRNFWSFVLSST